MTCPGTSYGVCSHDGGMAGGGELSGSWGTALQHGGEHAELGEKVSGSRDDKGTLGEVGDGPEPTNLTKMAGGPEVEEDIEGGVAARPGPRGSLRR